VTQRRRQRITLEEDQRIMGLMVNTPVDALREVLPGTQVVLFGSYAGECIIFLSLR
jgi:hypothetical protein